MELTPSHPVVLATRRDAAELWAVPCGHGGPRSPETTPCLGRGLCCQSSPAAMQEFSTNSTAALEEPMQTEGMSRRSHCAFLGTFSPVKKPLHCEWS